MESVKSTKMRMVRPFNHYLREPFWAKKRAFDVNALPFLDIIRPEPTDPKVRNDYSFVFLTLSISDLIKSPNWSTFITFLRSS